MRQTEHRDTRYSWAWRFILLNLFQVVSLALFAAVAILAMVGAEGVTYGTRSTGLFLCAAISYGSLLIWPHKRLVRIVSIAVPLLAAGSRLLEVVGSGNSLPAVAVWLYLAFVFSWIAPRTMPPPLTNGERRQWVHENGGQAVG